MRERVRQFRDAQNQPTDADYALARAHLNPALVTLFCAQHPRDIVHSAGTARWLLARGQADPDLIAAALLHDTGKGHQRRVDRVAYVIAAKLRLAAILGAAESRFELRRAIFRSITHSESGAKLLSQAGAPDRVITLTRLHHVPPGRDPVLALLQQADAAN